jgi:protein-disulfide isomerase
MIKRNFTGWIIIITAGWFLCLLFVPASSFTQNKSANETSMGSGPLLGSASAPVTVTEFSDFQCGFCKRFWAETLPKLKEDYINTGKARFAYRHFAILGKHSEQAALASECASEQGKFWEYHDQLFKNQGGLAFTEAKLKQYATGIGLNVGVFGTCLGTGKHKEKVEGETAAAANLGGRGTPFFIVNQRPLVGAQPYVVFQKMIDEELKSQDAKNKAK